MGWWGERPLRIAHLIHGWAMGGLEQLAMELCVLGQRAGLESMIISLGPDGPAREAAGARGIATRWLQLPGMRPRTLFEVKRALHEFDADILHAHDAGPWLNAALVRALRPQTPVLATFHQMDMPEGGKLQLARAACAVTGAIVACGAEVRERIEGWAPPFARIVTIGNGVRLPAPFTPEQRARARARLGIPEQAAAIGYLGRMAEIKGPDLLLQAFLAAFAGRDDVHLALVGGGELEDKLRAMAAGHANVHLPGTIPGAQELLAAFDVYAQTSLSEGRSLAMLEAMAAGLPTVAHALPGVREIHPDDSTALLAPLRDANALRGALEALVADPERRARMGAAARRASKRYGIEPTLDAYVDLYRALSRRAALPASILEAR